MRCPTSTVTWRCCWTVRRRPFFLEGDEDQVNHVNPPHPHLSSKEWQTLSPNHAVIWNTLENWCSLQSIHHSPPTLPPSPPICFVSNSQVRRQLERLNHSRAAGPDKSHHHGCAGQCWSALFFSSAFNAMQLVLLKERPLKMQLDCVTASWTTDYLTDRSQFLQEQECESEQVSGSTRAQQVTLLSPYHFSM